MRKLILTTAAVAAAIAGAFAAEPSFGTLTDTRDGQTYKTVKIGKQTWMAQNLNYNTPNGSMSCGSRCNDNSRSYCDKYGRLYDWEIAMTVCPAGWKLPDTADWNRLIATAGGKEIAGRKLKSKSGWDNTYVEGEDGNGTDDFGFSALPGGRCNRGGTFRKPGGRGYWWTATKYDGVYAYCHAIFYYDFVDASGPKDEDNYDSKENGHSVRCVKDNPLTTAAVAGAVAAEPSFGTLTDTRDGQKYKTVKIGKHTWMAQNLNYQTESGSWCYKDSISYCKQYGRLYDWKTAATVCPKGWKLPSREDWNWLVATAGGEEIAGEKLKSESGWNKNGNGTNDFGFSALPGGFRNSSGNFLNVGSSGYWWEATEDNTGRAYSRAMHYNGDGVYGSGYDYDYFKSHGHTVRCVQE